MIKKIGLLICCLLPFTTIAFERIEEFEVCCQQESIDTLQKVTQHYVSFIKQISTSETYDIPSQIFSPHCKRILNGKLCTQKGEDFLTNLISAYMAQGAKNIFPTDIIVDAATKTVVVRLFIETHHNSIYTLFSILRFNSHFLITEINEVICKVEETYNFKCTQ